jgi:hypothetical protein
MRCVETALISDLKLCNPECRADTCILNDASYIGNPRQGLHRVTILQLAGSSLLAVDACIS